MPGKNLTRDEAATRSTLIKTHSYRIDLDLISSAETFVTKTTVKFSGLKPGQSTFIDAVGKRVIAATLNGVAFDVKDYDGETIHLPALAAENELFLEIEAPYSNTGEGLHRFVDPADNEVYLYTQFETGDARQMYACFDQPDQKATFTISAITPKHWEVISNYDVDSVTDVGTDSKLTQFKKSQVISTYVTAIVAGAYQHVHDEYVGEKTIPLGIYARKSFFQYVDAENIFKVTKQGFAYFEKTFGLAYPFGKYDQLAVAEYNWGAMENVGCVTFHEDVLIFRSKVTESARLGRASTILHEMAHMWFGDLVTMAWWEDLWLNESFAEWASYMATSEATQYTHAWTEFNALRKNWAYRQDQLSTTHPIATEMKDLEDVKTNFDGISYAKGASVLQQLVEHVGRENFIKGLRIYFTKHAFKNTTLNDLMVELEATSGRDLKPWAATWLQTAGVNTLRPEIEIESGTYKKLAIKQEAPTMPAGSQELRPHRLRVALFDISDTQLVKRKSVPLDVAGALSEVTELKGEKEADLVLINDGDLSYAKLRFDDRSIATLKSHLGGLNEPLARALIWASLWDSVRDGELSTSDYIAIALNALGTETDISIVSATTTNITTVIWQYASPAHREGLRATVADALKKFLTAAASGSDHQLAFARGFAESAATPEQGKEILEILNGSVKGLTVDAEIRWHFVICAVKRGLLGETEIDAELAKDNTAHGKQYRALAHAAIPTSVAKERAFKSVTEDVLSNTIHSYTCRGFNVAMQSELLTPFIDQYFSMLIDLWNTKGYEIAETTATLLFPGFNVSDSTLAKTQNWLDVTGKDAPGALRRVIIEGRDALARSLRAQKKDA
ncbi:MAG: aminopeptidase N [Candidatus Planktophila sp.]